MACEHAVLIEPIAQVVYTNKRPYCKLFSVLVAALCLISFIGFVAQINTFIYELKTEVANLKDDNQRLANKLEAMNISELKMEVANLNKEVANLKEEDIYLWNEAWRHSVMGMTRGAMAWEHALPAVVEMEMTVLDMRSSEVAEAWSRYAGKWASRWEGQLQRDASWPGVVMEGGYDSQTSARVAIAQAAILQDTPNQYRDRKVKALRQDINALYV